jgi:hypothetical protein
MALGAFVAGLLLAETEFRHVVEQVIEPFKGLLLGLFFLAVGIGLDVGLILEQPLQIVGVTFGLMVLNTALIFGLGRAFGLNGKAAIETALLLAASGEFAFVILASAMNLGIVPQGLGQSLLVSATLSMMCIPLLAALGLRVAGRAGSGVAEAPYAPVGAPEGRILLVGFGRVGRLVGEMLPPSTARLEAVGWALLETFQMAFVGTVVGVLLSVPIAVLAARTRTPLARGLERASYIGFGLPGVVVGLSLVFFGANYAPWLYQTLALLIFAYAVRFVPEAMGSARSSLTQVSPRLEEAARGAVEYMGADVDVDRARARETLQQLAAPFTKPSVSVSAQIDAYCKGEDAVKPPNPNAPRKLELGAVFDPAT